MYFRPRLFLFKKTLLKILLPIATTFLVLETISYLLISFHVITPDFTIPRRELHATDKPYIKFDRYSGYKYVPGRVKVVQVINDAVVVDHTFSINDAGLCSIFNFEYKKNSKERRFIVFGDSYSACEITDTTWPDLLTIKMAASKGHKMTFYNFSLEASGILNWHSQFFNEVIPNFEYDGVIIAFSGNEGYSSFNLCRDYIIKHSNFHHNNLGFFRALPPEENLFYSNYESLLIPSSRIYDSLSFEVYRAKALDSYDTSTLYFKPVKPYFALNALRLYRLVTNYLSMKKQYRHRLLSEFIVKQYVCDTAAIGIHAGNEKFQKLVEMLEYLKQKNKKVVLVTIPALDIISKYSDSYKDNIYNHYTRCIAETYRAEFIDGYAIFDSIGSNELFTFSLQGDNHWNKKAIDLFVNLLRDHFSENQAFNEVLLSEQTFVRNKLTTAQYSETK